VNQRKTSDDMNATDNNYQLGKLLSSYE